MTKSLGLKSIRNFGLPLLLTFLEINQLSANTFSVTNGNVLITFRRSNKGVADLVVNAGPVSTFTNLAPNTKITITSFTSQQLSVIGTNDVAWSAWAYFDNTATPTSVRETLYMTKPRADVNTPTQPYYRDKSSGQGQVATVLGSIVLGAVNNANYSSTNMTSAVIEPESYNLSGGLALSYYNGLGLTLDFNQTFQTQPEQYTPDGFTTGGTPVRADFYWLPPAADFSEPPGIFLGYFEFSTNGVMTYMAYPSAPVVAPTIISYAHAGTTNTVTFTTGSSGTYTLRGTNSVGLSTARTNWPTISAVVGDGSNHSLTDIVTATNRFYVITAQ